MADKDPEYRTTYKKLASGRTKIYYFPKQSGTPSFFSVMDTPLSKPFPDAWHRAYREAMDAITPNQFEGDCAQLIVEFIGSPKFQGLARATQVGYTRDLGDARKVFGTASIKVMEDRRFRAKLIKWHHDIAGRSPRRADLCIVALRAAFEFALDRGVLFKNPADRIKPLYKSKDDKRPWMPGEIAKFLHDCPQATADAFMLAMYTALRRTDLAKITWDAWKGDRIEWETSKGRGRRVVVIPLTAEAKTFLTDLKSRQAASPLGLQLTMLVGANGRSMTPETLGKKVNERADALGIDNTLHRHRNTFATLLVKAGFEEREIAGIMGWNIHDVHELTRIYVKPDVIVADQVRRLRDQNRHG
ncbi:MAG: tyrosine-type recombinase/integrase [Pseudomonadota bacterium]